MPDAYGLDTRNGVLNRELNGTLQGKGTMGGYSVNCNLAIILDMTHANDVIRLYEDGIVPTMQCRMGTGGNQVPLVMQAVNENADT